MSREKFGMKKILMKAGLWPVGTGIDHHTYLNAFQSVAFFFNKILAFL